MVGTRSGASLARVQKPVGLARNQGVANVLTLNHLTVERTAIIWARTRRPEIVVMDLALIKHHQITGKGIHSVTARHCVIYLIVF